VTRSRSIETTENIHERGFSGTAGAHQRDEFTGPDLERNAAHSVHFHFASAIRFVHISKFDQRPIVHDRP